MTKRRIRANGQSRNNVESIYKWIVTERSAKLRSVSYFCCDKGYTHPIFYSAMINASTFSFLSELALNNDKNWFDANKPRYQTVKKNMEEFAGQIIERLAQSDADVAGIEAKNAIFRINRDVRFSKDKSPYKTHIGLWLAKGGKKSTFAGYYVHIEPGKSFFGAGLYMPATPELRKVRQEIAYCFEEFTGIINDPDFQKYYPGIQIEGHTLTKVPAGYASDHRAAEFLRLKSFFGIHSVTDAQLMRPDSVDYIVEGLKAGTPLSHFLNRGMED